MLDGWLAGTPLRHRPYRRYYFGSVAAALGYTMQATVAAWLMGLEPTTTGITIRDSTN